jgi:hypothetical protein
MIKTIQVLFPATPYLIIRLIQLFAVAASVILIYKTLKKITPDKISLFFSFVYALLPSWYFVPVLMAESFTLVTVVILIYVLSKVSESKFNLKMLIITSVVLSILTYLKPNNFLLFIVVAVYLFIKLKQYFLKSLLVVIVFFFLFLSPWLAFNLSKGSYSLTSAQGANLYIGTGMIVTYNDSVLARSAIKWKVDKNQNEEDWIPMTLGVDSNIPTQVQNDILTQKSIEIWGKRPLRQLGYSFDKVLIAFGIRANSMFEYTFGFYNLFALACGLLSLRNRAYRPWGAITLATGAILALQAAIFQADRRFIICVFLPISIITISTALKLLLSKIDKKSLISP